MSSKSLSLCLQFTVIYDYVQLTYLDGFHKIIKAHRKEASTPVKVIWHLRKTYSADIGPMTAHCESFKRKRLLNISRYADIKQ